LLATSRYSISVMERETTGCPLGDLGDEVGAQEHGITESGPARVRTASPINVGVNHELRLWGGSE
jgi:hypothetical protein